MARLALAGPKGDFQVILSGKVRDSIKIALAMVITYAIALSMNWEKPFWAGLAVALIAMTTVGQSINKGAMRLFGTLFACFVSFCIIALFPQDRWLFQDVFEQSGIAAQ